jgi:hypothetical protein
MMMEIVGRGKVIDDAVMRAVGGPNKKMMMTMADPKEDAWTSTQGGMLMTQSMKKPFDSKTKNSKNNDNNNDTICTYNKQKMMCHD